MRRPPAADGFDIAPTERVAGGFRSDRDVVDRCARPHVHHPSEGFAPPGA